MSSLRTKREYSHAALTDRIDVRQQALEVIFMLAGKLAQQSIGHQRRHRRCDERERHRSRFRLIDEIDVACLLCTLHLCAQIDECDFLRGVLFLQCCMGGLRLPDSLHRLLQLCSGGSSRELFSFDFPAYFLALRSSQRRDELLKFAFHGVG